MGFVFLALVCGTRPQASAQAQGSESQQITSQSLEDAWWTGPIIANSANTLPRGHFLVEPYFYDVMSDHSYTLGSSAFVEYGLANRFTVGLIPIIGFNKPSNGASTSGIGLGDVSFIAQFRLTQFHKRDWFPATAIQFQESFPTGKYDKLGNRPSDGIGSGAYASKVALNSQRYFWLPNGRILRMRLDASETLSTYASIHGVSVYRTASGFTGHARPGSSFFLNAAWEYSWTRNWVPALDITYRHAGNTRVTGYESLASSGQQNQSFLSLNSGSSDGYGFAPAIEYNYSSNLGIIFGTRFIPSTHNISSSITPVVAINIYH